MIHSGTNLKLTLYRCYAEKKNVLTMNSAPQGRENQQLCFVFVEYTFFIHLFSCALTSCPYWDCYRILCKRKRKKTTAVHIHLPIMFFFFPYQLIISNYVLASSLIIQIWHKGHQNRLFFFPLCEMEWALMSSPYKSTDLKAMYMQKFPNEFGN